MRSWKPTLLGILGGGMLAATALADDTELYSFDLTQVGSYRPKVLIIFDNSGTMGSATEVPAGYDPAVTYPAIGSDSSLSGTFLYFTKGGIDNSTLPVPGSPGESRRFLTAINSCNSAKTALDTYGFYTGHLREYSFQGQNGSWKEIPDNNGGNVEIIDCWDDIQNLDPVNDGIDPDNTAVALPDGFPVDGAGDKAAPVYYQPTSEAEPDPKAFLSASWQQGQMVTLYTDNYLRWYHQENPAIVASTRLEVAEDAIISVIGSMPGIDFGLAVFNLDYPNEGDRDGGRIVRAVKANDSANQLELITIINNLQARTNTPLCETLYEAYRYFSGLSVQYGDDDSNFSDSVVNNYIANIPPRDLAAETGGAYISPFDSCSSNGHIILITDGKPQMDGDADSTIQTMVADAITAAASLDDEAKARVLAEIDAYDDPVGYGTGSDTSYLPVLSGWLQHNDVDGNGDNGTQTLTTYTIGFGNDAVADAENLLRQTAIRGGGKYYPATEPLQLTSALQDALITISGDTSSLVTPAISTNNFDRTRTLNRIYYAMFLPGNGPRWRGNLKKLTVGSDGVIVDANGLPAISEGGSIHSLATTYWSQTSEDGNHVSKGGAAEMLAGKSSRVLYTDSGGSLTALTKANLSTHAGGDSALALYTDVAESELDSHINWISGVDVDDDNGDGDNTDRREDILGDPLHSRPLVLNYGPPSGNADDDPDIRILMGTNGGFLHMFQDSGATVDENWAFIPYALLPKQKTLRDNLPSSQHVYGIDGRPVAYLVDTDGDGVIESGASDKVWLYVGQRRGGSGYYAIDITDPDSPSLMWTLDNSVFGFAELGQSWSEPVVTKVAGHDKPVVIFAAGYDTSKDGSGLGGTDGVGRGIFMVDAEQGTLLLSMTPALTAGNNVSVAFTDSMPAKVSLLDSDGDGYTDRIYAADTGGNIWRVELKSTLTDSFAFKLAALGSDTAAADDRRFFTEPVLAQTYQKQIERITVGEETEIKVTQTPFDAILIGSGDRARPASRTTTENYYFMIRDEHTLPLSEAPSGEPIGIGGLYDISDDPVGSAVDETARLDALIALGAADGWKYRLKTTAEKTLGAGLVLAGQVYFTSFVPRDQAGISNTCQVTIGSGRSYVLDLHTGVIELSGGQAYREVDNKVPDDLDIFTEEDGDIRIIGGAPGDELDTSDGSDEEKARCEDAVCLEGSDDPKVSMAARKLYLFVGEEQ